jgi:FlaA1/EpsC-like NDP-sugar epimerase
LVSDKLFVAGNNYAGAGPTRFSVVRYGNVMGSRGSVIPFFLSKKGEGSLPITDPEMTRFMITLEEGVQLVWTALEEMQGGEIYVKKIPSMKVVDIARAIDPSAKLEVVGIRPGEKIHEQMISSEDASSTYDCGSHYVILPQSDLASRVEISKLKGKKVDSGFLYSSESNNHWMTRDELILWIQENADESGNIPLK